MEERVVFTTRYGVTYLFDECGVAALKSKSTSGLVAIEHLPGHVDNAPRLWSLVDCPLSPAPSPSSVTLDARPRMFFVAALSPDDWRRYKPFEGELSIRAWWMSRWSDDELLALLRHICSPFPERQSVRSVRETAGPVPRDILRLLVYPGGCDRQVAQELDFHSLQPTMVFISGAEAFSNEAEVCPGPAANANAGVVLVLWAVQIAGKREDPARPSASGPGGFGMAVRRLRECTRAVCPPGVPVEVEVKYALVVPVRQRRHGRRSARV